ncbi:hypothetical protein AN218_13085, partial [Streptomyces nanshensis]
MAVRAHPALAGARADWHTTLHALAHALARGAHQEACVSRTSLTRLATRARRSVHQAKRALRALRHAGLLTL